ncbi:hypothetical protein GGR53DRAFT_463367 [Hypoxylon sp. FL1150]|nr:hypothetical protein GGR53DRAFT_463367 [Hypoxylon sp. FL1150]
MSPLKDRFVLIRMRQGKFERDKSLVLGHARPAENPLTDDELTQLNDLMGNITVISGGCASHEMTLSFSNLEAAREASPEEYDRLERLMDEYEGEVQQLQSIIDACKDILGI